MAGKGGNFTQRVDIIDSFDPRIDGRAAQKGTLFRFIPASGDPELLIKLDDGFSTNWTSAGGSAQPITIVAAASTADVDLTSAPANLDGVAGATDDLWLIKDQTAPEENGVYVFTAIGQPLTRAPGWDTAASFIPGKEVFVDAGTVNADTLWANADYVTTLDTDPITFVRVSSSIVVGTPNTGAFYDNTGAIASNANFKFNQTQMAMSFGTVIDAGVIAASANGTFAHGLAGDGTTIQASSTGAQAFGAASTAGSTISAESAGALAYGTAETAGTIVASGVGSNAHGYSQNGSAIAASASGAVASGFAQDGAITASGDSSKAMGFVSNGGAITASNSGAHASGTADGAGSTIVASGEASYAGGNAQSGGDIIANAIGAFAHGTVFGGSIQSGGNSSFALGSVGPGSVLQASTTSCFALGSAEAGNIQATGVGSMALGYVTGNSNISSSGTGSLAFGRGRTSANSISASGDGALAHGHAAGGAGIANISASGEGSHCSGALAQGVIEASGQASFTHGFAGATASIINSGQGAIVVGAVDQSGSISNTGIAAAVFAYGVTGEITTVTAHASLTSGIGQVNSSFACLMIGRFGVSAGAPNGWVDTDCIFVIGNGPSVGSESNAYQIDKDGKIYETAAKRILAIRTVTTSYNISQRTDRKLLLNDVAAGVNNLGLPGGEEGLEYTIAKASTDTGTWTLNPNGGDTLDGNIDPTCATPQTITYSGTVWYLI